MTESSAADASTSARPVRLTGGAALADFLADHERALVEFYTANCGLCASIEPIVGLAARETGIPTALVNPGDDLSLVDDFDIRRVPTLALFEEREEVARYDEGFIAADDLVRFVQTGEPPVQE